ncbi:Aldehyde reductase 2 [Paramyrothecium foliicola]|nr:Aldehyde reductase 2 [Paramyrothecium foliicola]
MAPSRIVLALCITVKGATSILWSAIKESKIKRFVFTSSSISTSLSAPGKRFKIDKHSWNIEIEDWVDPAPPYLPENASKVYAASKTRTELAIWDFVKSQKPWFAVNTILPSVDMGRAIASAGEAGGLVNSVFKGKVDWDFPPQYMVDVVDCARLHLIALIDGTVQNERIIAFNVPFNWNVVLDQFRTLFLDKSFVENQQQGEDVSEVDNAQGAELLIKRYGQQGYTPLKESLQQNIKHRI